LQSLQDLKPACIAASMVSKNLIFSGLAAFEGQDGKQKTPVVRL